MKYSAELNLVLTLAARQAGAGGFAEVVREHLLAALVECVELAADELPRHCRDAQNRAGPAGPSHQSPPLSPGAQLALRTAMSAAQKRGASEVWPEDLLLVLVLGLPRTPLLQRFGRDLNRAAAWGPVTARGERAAEQAALLRALNDPRRRGVFLIGGLDSDAAAVLADAALSVVAGTAPHALQEHRLVDVREAFEGRTRSWADGMIGEFRAEAAGGQVVLVEPAAWAASADENDSGRAAAREALAFERIRVVWPVKPSVYRRLIRADPSWRRLAHELWISREAGGVPDEL